MAKETAKSKKNTTKTARVLGLLTSPPPTEEPLEAAAASQPKATAPKQTDDKMVESQVRSALELELVDLLIPAEEEEPMPPDPAPAQDDGEPVFEELVPETVVPEPPPEPAPAEPAAPKAAQSKHPRSVKIKAFPDPLLEQEEFTCFNVMQALVEAKAEKYIKLFGLCNCSRCHTDVVALALSNLPAKYVVTSDKEMVPLLSVYEGTYSAAVISQVMNACKRVIAYPRHKV